MRVIDRVITKHKDNRWGGNKRRKLKAQERAVVMLLGNDHLPFLIQGMYVVIMVKKGIVYVFLRHYTCQEHHEQKRA